MKHSLWGYDNDENDSDDDDDSDDNDDDGDSHDNDGGNGYDGNNNIDAKKIDVDYDKNDDDDDDGDDQWWEVSHFMARSSLKTGSLATKNFILQLATFLAFFLFKSSHLTCDLATRLKSSFQRYFEAHWATFTL